LADEPIVVPLKRRNLHGLFGFLTYLCVRGSDQVGIALSMFHKDDVVRACKAKGWSFT
jgi:hypothetical protein